MGSHHKRICIVASDKSSAALAESLDWLVKQGLECLCSVKCRSLLGGASDFRNSDGACHVSILWLRLRSCSSSVSAPSTESIRIDSNSAIDYYLPMFRPTILVLFVSLAVLGCGEKKEKAAPEPPKEEAPQAIKDEPIAPKERSCKEEAAELRAFLTSVVDESAEVSAPWPTGDAELDERIEKARLKMREAMQPDPSKRQAALSDEIDTSVDEEMYRDCPQGLAALEAVGKAAPDKRAEMFINIADGVEACDCKVEIRWLKAAYYMYRRGPD